MGFASRARRRARRARREPSVFFAAARVACVLASVARAVARPANPVPNLPRQQRHPAGPPRRALAQATPSPAPPPPPHATVSTLADLRAHVASSSPTAVITLAASLDLGGDELPVVEKALEIRGACAPTACVLDAGAASRHLTVGVLGDLTLVDVVLARGVAVGLLEATAAPSSSTARSSRAASSSPTIAPTSTDRAAEARSPSTTDALCSKTARSRVTKPPWTAAP